MIESEVLELMKSSKSEIEWEKNCNTVKERCNGYPDFWYSAIIFSDVMGKTVNKWIND